MIPVCNVPRDYAWGSPTLLAELEGREPDGRPEAEVWFGDHPGDPADMRDGGTLDEVTGGGLPYLVKLLAAGAPLSIQAHPTRAQAMAGAAREAHLAADDPARNYRDDNHKPELLVALSDRFEVLAGLRPVARTQRIVAALGDAAGVVRLRAILAGDGDVLRDAVAWALRDAAASDIDDIIAAVRGAHDAGGGREAGDDEALAAVAAIAARHPGDPGVVVALLMNHVVLGPGEGIFVPAGMLHAYLSGLGIEIMAASDNVLRGGLTPKHIDVAELLAILDSTPGEAQVQRPDAAASVVAYDVPVADFALRRFLLGSQPVDVALAGPAMIVATEGDVSVSSDAGGLRVPVGQAVFATAEESHLRLAGPGRVFIAQPG